MADAASVITWIGKALHPAVRPPEHEISGERKYRPDVEGLRAVAVLFVALYHAHIPGIRSGYIGVDVFFVISGYLITGLLLRERTEKGTTSISKFYGRRARRILPATTVVVLVVLFASYHWLGFLTGNSVANDAKWTAIFAANIHFALIGTNYLASQAPPSPLQHMWSLGVEEQFYVVWPTLFFLVAVFGKKSSIRVRLGIVLSLIVVASFVWSVVETSQNVTWAYFSPFTRAWELAIGGLIAVATPALARIPTVAAKCLGAIGLGGVLLSGFIFSDSTPYPGSAVALPVIATCTVITAGCVVANGPAELVLGLRPSQWMGKRSFSFYLWHWPVLIIAYEHAGHQLNAWQNAGWLVVALLASMASYRLVENPIRFAKPLAKRAWLSLLMGAILISASLIVAQVMIHSHYG